MSVLVSVSVSVSVLIRNMKHETQNTEHFHAYFLSSKVMIVYIFFFMDNMNKQIIDCFDHTVVENVCIHTRCMYR